MSATADSAEHRLWRVHHALLAALLATAGWIAWSVLRGDRLLKVTTNSLTVQDFASHCNYARRFWSDGADYSVASHLGMMERWAGKAVPWALPFAYSPTMLLLLAPFAVLPLWLAYITWTIVGLAAVAWMTRPTRTLPTVGSLLFLSAAGLGCLMLGQTAILFAAGLTLLVANVLNGSDRQACLVIWALTAKPPVALAASAGMVAARRFRPVLAGMAIALATTALLTPRLGPDWIKHYLSMATHYDTLTADTVFAWSLRPETMGNLRGLLSTVAGISDLVAVRVSAAVWLVVLVATPIAGVRFGADGRLLFALSVAGYLLFCPHVSFTEDLQLHCLLTAVLLSDLPRGWQWTTGALAVADVFLGPGGGMYLPPLGPAVSFSVKLLLVAVVTRQLCRQPRRFDRATAAGRDVPAAKESSR